MITLRDYYMGRNESHRGELTDQIAANAQTIVNRANILLTMFYEANPQAARRNVRSGWRPAAVNAGTPNAAAHSKHLTAEAIDVEDNDRELAKWCAAKTKVLEAFEVWMERPEATPTWCHWQSGPPGSGVRYFWPNQTAYAAFQASGAAPMVAA